MSEENPVGNKNTDNDSETVEVSQEEYKQLSELAELAEEYEELRQEFLAEMRDDVRQQRVGGDFK